MRTYQKVIWFIVFCIIISSAVFFSIKFIEKSNVSKIEKSYDTRLAGIREGQNLALRYLNVFKIRNAESYKEIKELLYRDLSGELQQEIFGMEEYTLSEIGPITYNVKDIKATTYNGKYLYKVELEVKSDKVMGLYLLIGVQNNKVVSVEKL